MSAAEKWANTSLWQVEMYTIWKIGDVNEDVNEGEWMREAVAKAEWRTLKEEGGGPSRKHPLCQLPNDIGLASRRILQLARQSILVDTVADALIGRRWKGRRCQERAVDGRARSGSECSGGLGGAGRERRGVVLSGEAGEVVGCRDTLISFQLFVAKIPVHSKTA